MQQRFNVSASARTLVAGALTAAPLAALTACGGGGGNTATATVSSMSIAGTPKYGAAITVTVVGTNLSNLNLQTNGCKNVTRLTAAPTASTDTTAYFQCTPSGAYSSTILAVSNGGTISQTAFTVPAPIVSMAVSGAGVNGNIIFNLKGDVAPITVDNFLAYVNAGFYNGLILHRIADFTNPQAGQSPYEIIQGGGYGPTTSGTLPTPKTPLYSAITLETSGGGNVQWTAAMARGTGADTAQSQFFFNVANNTAAFDSTTSGPGYAVFANVSGSQAILNQIAALYSQSGACTPLVGFSDGSCVPVPNVTIISATQTQ